MVKDADVSGTSPGKEVLKSLLERYAPCVVLIDELVAYIRSVVIEKEEGHRINEPGFVPPSRTMVFIGG